MGEKRTPRSRSVSRFLTAEWRNLAMLNYQVDPRILYPFVPASTELDLWHGKAFISLVGFQFLNTRVLGIAIPFHRNFEEVNLRFYVRRHEGGEVRRGVTFIREIVPRPTIAAIANRFYNERYKSLPMSYTIERDDQELLVEYAWNLRGDWNTLAVVVSGDPSLPTDGSEEQFIAEHYWGYTSQRDRSTLEYRVEHPPWRVWKCRQATFAGDVEELYGRDFATILQSQPTSAFLAEGSDVTVFQGGRL